MDDRPSSTPPRPLGRSLGPLKGESLAGFLLRLSFRLHLAPIGLAHLTGCIRRTTTTALSRRLLLDLDIEYFAAATQLAHQEAAGLTLRPWADRYPPIARSLTGTTGRPSTDDWLFNTRPRFCPHCLAGDGSALQQQLGGPWKKIWHLPIAFACVEHRVFLQHGCPTGRHPDRLSPHLLAQIADNTLHPAQCRQPGPGHPADGRTRPSCGAYLNRLRDTGDPCPGPDVLQLQRRLLDMFDPHRPTGDDAGPFTDLRLITALLCASWPLGRDLIAADLAESADEHIRMLTADRTRLILDAPPTSPLATAALLTASAAVRDSVDLQSVLAQHVQASRNGRPSRAPWATVFARHESSCSDALRQAAEPLLRAFRRTAGPHSARAPARTDSYRPEHIPAFLEQAWFLEHLAPLHCGSCVTTARRVAAATLVQRVAGRSIGDAGHYLGFNPDGGQYAPSHDFYQWLTALGPDRFTQALSDLAQRLDTAADLVDYRRRREALRDWSLTLDEWHDITDRLPPVPGPFKPVLDDRKRQEASAFVWAHVTQGELRFAPRPIEAAQPTQVRRAWQLRHGPTGFQLSRPDPVRHYADLRALLGQRAVELAHAIDTGIKIPSR
ncbi:TniQ family protein [Catenulispora rubra]|uniref:TniQ family protein n=1 Tax=Catenulispora rubra TaxID=280293 RepID=UPI0018920798|nr:TniQ family protein [Catenulispora rubra]